MALIQPLVLLLATAALTLAAAMAIAIYRISLARRDEFRLHDQACRLAANVTTSSPKAPGRGKKQKLAA